jgi:hypothetical protein
MRDVSVIFYLEAFTFTVLGYITSKLVVLVEHLPVNGSNSI